jgi:hypothetical protein
VPIETATYIHDFNPAYPVHGDSVGIGDSHLRLIKQVLQATFPNLTAPVTSTPLQLNSYIPTGIIAYWYGSGLSVPTGWGICNGSVYAKVDGSGNITSPSLTDKFIVGAGNLYTQGALGGAVSNTPILTDVSGTVLVKANLPSYALTVSDPGHYHLITDPSHSHAATYQQVASGTAFVAWCTSGTASGMPAAYTGINNTAVQYTGISVNSGGSGNAHFHTITSAAVPTLPPYVALYPIMKL